MLGILYKVLRIWMKIHEKHVKDLSILVSSEICQICKLVAKSFVKSNDNFPVF